MAPSAAPNTVREPFPISLIANRYLLFSVDVISHCRRNHNICGMLVGTIPNLSQQNVFLGIPLELMPEEARVLVENGAAYIVDDEEVHRRTFMEMSRKERLDWLEQMDKKGQEVTRRTEDAKEKRTERALQEKGLSKVVTEKEKTVAESTTSDETIQTERQSSTGSDLGFIMKGSSFSDSWVELPIKRSVDTGLGFIMKGSSFSDSWIEIPASGFEEPAVDTALFDSTPTPPAAPLVGASSRGTMTQKHSVTPTASYPPLPLPSPNPSASLPPVPKSYPLFRYTHSLGYYHMPGLRFGCHYNTYPGDPLRYHSHFAATGLGWDEEFDLMDIVGGGRLATGTKKAYMIGGEDANIVKRKQDGGDEGGREVRAFSVEWAAL
jgi:tRNA-splicing endonuclease subunit Sen34